MNLHCEIYIELGFEIIFGPIRRQHIFFLNFEKIYFSKSEL